MFRNGTAEGPKTTRWMPSAGRVSKRFHVEHSVEQAVFRKVTISHGSARRRSGRADAMIPNPLLLGVSSVMTVLYTDALSGLSFDKLGPASGTRAATWKTSRQGGRRSSLLDSKRYHAA